MTRCYLLHQPLRSGGAREATRADKKKNAEKIAPLPAQARVRRWEGRLEPSLGGQGAGLAISEPPAILREITRAGLRASCDEDARPRLSSWKRPATGRGKMGGGGRGNGESVRETKKHAPGEIWVEKITIAMHAKTQSKRPLARGKISPRYHHVSTALSPHPSPDWPADVLGGSKPSSRSPEMRAPTPEPFAGTAGQSGYFSARAYPGPKVEFALAVIPPARSSRDALAAASSRDFAPAKKKQKSLIRKSR